MCVCKIQNCNKPAWSRGHCRTHYKDLPKINGIKVKCKHKTCNSWAVCKGYCRKHDGQMRRFGRTLNSSRIEFNEIIEKKNHIELVLTNRAMEEVGRAKLDKEDLEVVQKFSRWCLNDQGYVINHTNNVRTAMHRLIMNAQDKQEVDHKKAGVQNRSDNRKNNLRICTKVQNLQNSGKRISNSSGYKNVNWIERDRKWIARITVDRKRIVIGYFDDPKVAYKAYCSIAKTKHKEFFHK